MIPRTYLDDWKTGRDQTQHLNIYTDGSKMEGGVGAGLYCTDPELGLSYKLPSDCSIFQAEVFAIRKSAEVAQLVRGQPSGDKILAVLNGQFQKCNGKQGGTR